MRILPRNWRRAEIFSTTEPIPHTHEENFREEILARGHTRNSAGAVLA
jgi:hypothetical protein